MQYNPTRDLLNLYSAGIAEILMSEIQDMAIIGRVVYKMELLAQVLQEMRAKDNERKQEE
jgi:hypothetical protein